MAPKSKNSDAGTSNMPKRSYKSASYQWRGESSRLKKERKESCTEIAKIYGKNEASVKLWKRKKKKIQAGFADTPQTAKLHLWCVTSA